MNSLSDQFFSSAALPGYENCGIGRRHTGDHIEQVLHDVTFSNDFVELILFFQLAAEQDIFIDQFFMRDDLFDVDFYFIRVKGFYHVIKCPHLHGLNSRIHCGIGGHHDYFSFRPDFLEPLHRFKSIHAGHFQIQENHFKVFFLDHGNSLFPA